jgi:DNA-binding winged helix-turn-helix (wHTH) protein
MKYGAIEKVMTTDPFDHISPAPDQELSAEEQLAELCSRRFQLNQWLVDPKANQLWCQALDSKDPLSLEPRIMFLLCILAANAGRVVTRHDLMTKLWPKVIVNENSLTRAVSDLRKTLDMAGGSAAELPLIDTIPKRGYRLNASVSLATAHSPARRSSVVSASPTTDASPHAEPASTGSRAAEHWSPRTLRYGAATAMAIAALFLWQFPSDPNRAPAMIDISSTAIVLDPVENQSVPESVQTAQPPQSVLSRNGDLFAYVSYNDAGSSLNLGSLTSFSPPVTIYDTEELIFNLQWSPVDNILLFAQTPRFSPAAMSSEREVVRLVMIDLSTMAATVLNGDNKGPEVRTPFNFT